MKIGGRDELTADRFVRKIPFVICARGDQNGWLIGHHCRPAVKNFTGLCEMIKPIHSQGRTVPTRVYKSSQSLDTTTNAGNGTGRSAGQPRRCRSLTDGINVIGISDIIRRRRGISRRANSVGERNGFFRIIALMKLTPIAVDTYFSESFMNF